MFEEFLFTWQDRLRKLEQPTAMSFKLQGEVDKYKVDPNRDDGIAYFCPNFSLSIFILGNKGTCLDQNRCEGLRLQCQSFG